MVDNLVNIFKYRLNLIGLRLSVLKFQVHNGGNLLRIKLIFLGSYFKGTQGLQRPIGIG